METVLCETSRFGQARLTTESPFCRYHRPMLVFAQGGTYTPADVLPTGIRAAEYVRRMLIENHRGGMLAEQFLEDAEHLGWIGGSAARADEYMG